MVDCRPALGRAWITVQATCLVKSTSYSAGVGNFISSETIRTERESEHSY